MDLITSMLRKAIGLGVFALCVPLAAAALGDGEAEIGSDEIIQIASITGGAALKDAGVDAEDLANGFRVIMRTQAEAQADLDKRYASAMVE